MPVLLLFLKDEDEDDEGDYTEATAEQGYCVVSLLHQTAQFQGPEGGIAHCQTHRPNDQTGQTHDHYS